MKPSCDTADEGHNFRCRHCGGWVGPLGCEGGAGIPTAPASSDELGQSPFSPAGARLRADTVDQLLTQAIRECWIGADPDISAEARAEALRDALMLLRHSQSEIEIGLAATG